MNNPLLNDLAGDMPEVTEVADIITAKVQNEKQENIPSEEPPSPGPKKRGRKPGQKNKAKENQSAGHGSKIGGVLSKQEFDLAAENQERLATAIFITEMMERSGVALAGNSGLMHELEKTGLVGIWDKYLLKSGIKDLPPGVMLCMITGQYYARVFMAEEAAPKTRKIKDWFSRKVFSIYGRFKNARSNRGNDSKRQNNASQETGNDLSE